MDNNNGIATTSRKTTNLSKSSTFLSRIDSMEDLDKIVDYIATSPTYSSQFKVRITNTDGKLEDVVDRSAIATCLMVGSENGFKPFESLMLGRTLGTKESIIKIHRGRDLGLSAITALQNIYVFDSGGRECIYTSIHVIYKCLTDAHVLKEVLEDGTKPYYEYFTAQGNNPVDTQINVGYSNDTYVCTNTGIPAEAFKAALVAGKIPITRKTGYRAVVKLTRGDEVIAIPYTMQQAIDASLYKGVNSDGETVKGKTNWNNHLAAHLVKMSATAGARMIIGDILQGSVYIADELPVNPIEEGHAEIVD